MEQVGTYLSSLSRVIEAQEQFYTNVKVCPGRDKCKEGKLDATIKLSDGTSDNWSFKCPAISWACPFGQKNDSEARDFVRGKVMESLIKVPRVHTASMNPIRSTQAVKAMRNWDGKNWIILIGETRTGKSCAAAVYIYERLMQVAIGDEDRPDRWRSNLDSVQNNIGWGLAYEINESEEHRGNALGKHLYVLDDLATEDKRTASVIGYVLSKRWESQLPTIITTNLSLQDIKNTYGRRIHERIKDATYGNVISLTEGCYREYEDTRRDYE